MSQISLTFQFDTLHHLTAFLQLVTPHTALRAANVAVAAEMSSRDVVSPVEAAAPKPVVVEPVKAKRGRPRKAQPENAAPVEAMSLPLPTPEDSKPAAAPVLAAEPTPAVVLSKDSVLAALQGMHDHLVSLSPTPEAGKKSALQACIDLLTRYGATRFGEVLPEQYPKFMADIADMLAGKDIAAAS